MGRTPELDGVDTPLIVVVQDPHYPLAVSPPFVESPPASTEPPVNDSMRHALAVTVTLLGVFIAATIAVYFAIGSTPLWDLMFRPGDVAYEGAAEWRATGFSVAIGAIAAVAAALRVHRLSGRLRSR